MSSNGVPLEEIYRASGSFPEIKAAFQEPYLMYKAGIISAQDAARAYTKDSPEYLYDTRLAWDIFSAQIANSLKSEKDKEAFKKYSQNLIQANKLHPNSRYYDGTIYFTQAGLLESNYIKIEEGKYFVASADIIQMIKVKNLKH